MIMWTYTLLSSFMTTRYSHAGNTGIEIYSGITTNFEELGKSIGDVDITDIRYFNKSIPIHELLGFDDHSMPEGTIDG